MGKFAPLLLLKHFLVALFVENEYSSFPQTRKGTIVVEQINESIKKYLLDSKTFL
jgi:hypothetical protein